MKKPDSLRLLFFFFSIMVIIMIDIASKLFMSELLEEKTISVLGEYIKLTLFYNSGVAFSLPIQGIILQVLTILIIVSILYYYFRYEWKKRSLLLDLGYIAILGGALSHAYERIMAWEVVDFIQVKYFAVLNLADIFISVWALCIIIYYFFYDRKE